MFGALILEPVTEVIASQAAEHLGKYRRSHPGVDVVDYVVAATAQVLEARLLTLDVKHFPWSKASSLPFAESGPRRRSAELLCANVIDFTSRVATNQPPPVVYAVLSEVLSAS